MTLVRKLLIFLLVLAAMAASVLFALQNTAMVPLDLLVYSLAPQSVSLWVLAAFALGGLLGMLVSGGIVLRLRAKLLASKRQLQRLQQKLESQREDSTSTND